MRWQCRRILHKENDAKCVDMVHIDAFGNKNIDAFSINLMYIEAKSNSKKTKPFSIWAASHNAA